MTTTTHEIRLSPLVVMTDDDEPADCSVYGLGWKTLDAMHSGDYVTITDDEGTFIGTIIDVDMVYGNVWIELT